MDASTLGMWTFLITEVLFFGGMFASYAVYRAMYPDAFASTSEYMNVVLGGTNTAVLICSSLTMVLSVHAVRTGQQKMLLTCLTLTIVLGGTFLGLKALEYYIDYKENLVPGLAFEPGEWTALTPPVNPRRVQLMLVFYYIMTGLHAVHMIVGMGLLVWLIARARKGTRNAVVIAAERIASVRA